VPFDVTPRHATPAEHLFFGVVNHRRHPLRHRQAGPIAA
jgi:hypothetical protein